MKTENVLVPRELLERTIDRLMHGHEHDKALRELRALLAQPASEAVAALAGLLPELDEALEKLEVHGRHSDQGYRQLRDWYRKVALATKQIDASQPAPAERLQADVDGLAAVRSIVDLWLAPGGIRDRLAMIEIARCIGSVALTQQRKQQ